MTLTKLRELAERATPGPRLRLWASTTVIAPFCDDIFDPKAAGPIGAQVNLDLAAACSPEVIKALVAVAERFDAVIAGDEMVRAYHTPSCGRCSGCRSRDILGALKAALA